MNKVLLAQLFLAVGFCLFGATSYSLAQEKAVQEVRAVLTEQVKAWNAGDLERFMNTYWKCEKLVFYSGGTITKGHTAVLERYRKNYQADGKEMGKLTFSDLEVEMLAEEVALARGKWKVELTKETVEGLFSVVLKKTDQGWKIIHDHTSKKDPPKTP